MSSPQQNPAPLGDGPKPDFPSSAGSDHNKSHNDPWWGISWTLLIDLIWSSCSIYGERPPWRQNT